MQIHGLQSAQAAQSISRSSAAGAPAGKAELAARPNSSGSDQLELSSEAMQISQAQATGQTDSVSNGIRTEKVAALRQAIAAGTYETPENMSAALDNLLDTFA